MESIRVTRWDKTRAPSEKELREDIRMGNPAPYIWSNAPGDEYSPHSHAYAKVIYVVSGSIIWFLPQTNERIETRPGDRIEIPPGVVHAALVGREGVSCLEAHRE